VHAVPAVRRVAVCGIPGDEDMSSPIRVGDREAQVPEADVLELDVERLPYGCVKVRAEVEVVGGRPGRDRGVEEPGIAEIDAAEELPVALKLGLQNVEVGLAGIAAQ